MLNQNGLRTIFLNFGIDDNKVQEKKIYFLMPVSCKKNILINLSFVST